MPSHPVSPSFGQRKKRQAASSGKFKKMNPNIRKYDGF
jgi:hypothetical protein